MQYLLDANVFIGAYNSYYKKTVVPSFWEFLKDDVDVFTLLKVKGETTKKDDGLYELIKSVKIKTRNDETIAIANKVSEHIKKNYGDKGLQEFSFGADFDLVCVAKQYGMVLVTHEKLVGPDSTKIKIPNICEVLETKYMNTYQFLEEKRVCLGEIYEYLQ